MALLKVKAPYSTTESDPEKSITDINKLLRKYGINDYQWTTLWDQGKIELRMVIETLVDGKPRKYAIMVSPPIFKAKRRTWDNKLGRYVSKDLPNYSQAMRMLFYWLKTKIEAVSFGLKEVQEEFMSDLIVHLPDGRESTVGKATRLQLSSDGIASLPKLGSGEEPKTVDAKWKEAPP